MLCSKIESPLSDLGLLRRFHEQDICRSNLAGALQRLVKLFWGCQPAQGTVRVKDISLGVQAHGHIHIIHGYEHLFLKYAKVLRQAGHNVDDDLTPLQQQERRFLEEDAETLRSKGYHPFFRGSHLHYFHKEKMHTCRKGNASSLPSASLAAEFSHDIRKTVNAGFDKIFGSQLFSS